MSIFICLTNVLVVCVCLEIAALNLAKFRKAQQELEETEDRARMAEASLSAAY